MVRAAISALALVMFVGGTAAAADFGQAELDAMPEYRPSGKTAGWYLRGDVTYSVDSPVYDFSLAGEETDNLRLGAGAGVGYRFNDMFRTDVTVGFLGRDSFDYDDGVTAVSASHSMWSGLVNAYADLGTFIGITPYVGAGVGVLHTRDDFSASIPGFAATLDDSQTEFAFALNAGVGYRMSDNLTLDAGYQYFSSPNTAYFNTDSLSLDEGVDFHQIRIGLRYEFK